MTGRIQNSVEICALQALSISLTPPPAPTSVLIRKKNWAGRFDSMPSFTNGKILLMIGYSQFIFAGKAGSHKVLVLREWGKGREGVDKCAQGKVGTLK